MNVSKILVERWMFFPKNFPTYPERNIQNDPQPTVYDSEFLNHLGVVWGSLGYATFGVCWASLRFWLKTCDPQTLPKPGALKDFFRKKKTRPPLVTGLSLG